MAMYNPNKLVMSSFLFIPEHSGVEPIINGTSDIFLKHTVSNTRSSGKTYVCEKFAHMNSV